jgi:hypothetical protein
MVSLKMLRNRHIGQLLVYIFRLILQALEDDDDVYLIEITTCGLQNLSPYQYGISQNGISTRCN